MKANGIMQQTLRQKLITKVKQITGNIVPKIVRNTDQYDQLQWWISREKNQSLTGLCIFRFLSLSSTYSLFLIIKFDKDTLRAFSYFCRNSFVTTFGIQLHLCLYYCTHRTMEHKTVCKTTEKIHLRRILSFFATCDCLILKCFLLVKYTRVVIFYFSFVF